MLQAQHASKHTHVLQIMATEATFNEDSMRQTLERLAAIEKHMQLPPGAIDSFSRLLDECTQLRAEEAAKVEQATAGQDPASLRFPGEPLPAVLPVSSTLTTTLTVFMRAVSHRAAYIVVRRNNACPCRQLK
jgi:hypothetical protein